MVAVMRIIDPSAVKALDVTADPELVQQTLASLWCKICEFLFPDTLHAIARVSIELLATGELHGDEVEALVAESSTEAPSEAYAAAATTLRPNMLLHGVHTLRQRSQRFFDSTGGRLDDAYYPFLARMF